MIVSFHLTSGINMNLVLQELFSFIKNYMEATEFGCRIRLGERKRINDNYHLVLVQPITPLSLTRKLRMSNFFFGSL